MNPKATLLSLALFSAAGGARADDESFDRVRRALAWQTPGGDISAQVSGTLDLEGYAFRQPSPGYLDEEGNALFNPRLSLFLDAQAGPWVYGFVQARLDRGFDPAPEPLEMRLDEYALRVTVPGESHLTFQVGQFATVVGNWTPRHLSWDNPFVTAPLVYENVTGIWDGAAAGSLETLTQWAGLRPSPETGETELDKYLSVPVLWGPSYSTGVSVSARPGPWLLSAELKNTPLSSRPTSWSASKVGFGHPTVSGRIAYQPSPRWEVGLSGSDGTYLLPSARAYLPAGSTLGDYRQKVLGVDASWSWHHLQVWAEAFVSTFSVHGHGHVSTTSEYVEVRQRLDLRWSLAARLNHQDFSTITLKSGERLAWGREVWRFDLAPELRLSTQLQLKFQYSLQHEQGREYSLSHFGAAQVTLRF